MVCNYGITKIILIYSRCNCKCILGLSVAALQQTLLSHIFCFFSHLLHQCRSKQLSLNQFTSHPPKTDFHESWKLSPGFAGRVYRPKKAPVPQRSLADTVRRPRSLQGHPENFPNMLPKPLRFQNLRFAAARTPARAVPPPSAPRSAPRRPPLPSRRSCRWQPPLAIEKRPQARL